MVSSKESGKQKKRNLQTKWKIQIESIYRSDREDRIKKALEIAIPEIIQDRDKGEASHEFITRILRKLCVAVNYVMNTKNLRKLGSITALRFT